MSCSTPARSSRTALSMCRSLVSLAQQPVAGVTQQPAGAEEHAVLHVRGHGVVERLDVGPHRAHGKDFTRDGVGARDRGRIGFGVFLRARHEHRTHAVHQAVGGGGGDDLAAQTVPRNLARITLAHGRREIALHLAREVGIVGQIGIEQVIAEPDLAVRQHHRELGTREPEALLAALEEFVVARQEFDGAIQIATALQFANQALVFGQPLGRALLEHRQRLGLQVVVPQHQARDFVGHAGQ